MIVERAVDRVAATLGWRLLGPVEGVDDTGRTVGLGGPKQVAVFSILVSNAGRVVSTDELIEELWPDEYPEASRKTVQAYVARLRNVLKGAETSGSIRSAPRGYVFEPGGAQTDAICFERLTSEAKAMVTEAPHRASSELEEALQLWRGRPFENAHPTPALDLEAGRLEELRLTARESLAEAELQTGRAELLVPRLRVWAEASPLREHLWALLILARYQSGRQAEALRTAEDLRIRLREELGVEPSKEIRDLERSMLEQDPTLDRPADAPRISRRTAGRSGRRRWLVIAALIVAVLAVVAGLLSTNDDAGPTIGARYLLPPGSTAAVAAGDAIWVLVPDDSAIVSLDPQTGEHTEFALADRPSTMAAGFGAVFVASEEAGRISKIDPAGGRVLAEATGLDLDAAVLTVGSDALWIIREDRRPLLRVDPSDLTVSTADLVSDIQPTRPSVAAGRDLVWATNSDIGRVLWFDPAGGRFGFAGDARLGSHAPRSIVASRDSVWFSQPTNGSVVRVDPATGAVTATPSIGRPSSSNFPLLRRPYSLTYGPGGLWAALPEDGTVVRLDEATGAVTATLKLGAPSAAFAANGSVWVLDERLEQLVRIDPETCDTLPFIGVEADLRGCDLSETALLGVDLTGADLRWATVGSIVLNGVDFTDADLLGADLRQALLDGVVWSATRCPDGSLSDDHGDTCIGHLVP